jgi:hypothetical protein
MLFGQITLLSRNSGKNKKGNLVEDCLFGSRVGLTTAGSNEIRADFTALLLF